MIRILTDQELRELDPHWCLLNLHYTDPKYIRAFNNTIKQRTGRMMSETGMERWMFEHGKIDW